MHQPGVRLADLEQVRAWRETWIQRGLAMLKEIELPAYVAPANDPFFGRGGRMLAANQREQQLKFEIVVPITSEKDPTAIMSFNYHQDHFGTTWGLRSADGTPAHTGCVAFGMDRLVVALFWRHGLDTGKWPAGVRSALSLS